MYYSLQQCMYCCRHSGACLSHADCSSGEWGLEGGDSGYWWSVGSGRDVGGVVVWRDVWGDAC